MKDRVLILSQYLFAEPEASLYAVLDGASIPGLRKRLYQDEPESVCLYRGELKPDLAECAPYLVRLEPNSPFADWVLQEGWGRHWGIFALSRGNLVSLRKHFRTFLMVRNPEGKQVYFRYYDPRVLRVYLPTCNAAETQILFGPVQTYFCEEATPEVLLAFNAQEGLPKKQSFHLGPVPSSEVSPSRPFPAEFQ